ncbi:signal peptidase complex catalytic subunit SEC11 [Aspergillus lentulus]|uniref:Signal peptidase complex catalytic subunit SEC11 n=1 Tax=Aspergillus lentulus TaxID=293939 RepID=A0AAN4PF87_ASPLE|nr:hypothetical protein CNMCM6936_005247 [Aspergillus lentulus]KAF4181414.1 hypothetical protein CNMCM7927_000650 [Aspergillus lentulus]KAF4198184.1 hypothetical protein CNMCM8694_000868 [Aspergillus lentulus]GAQ05251.1 signal peptidase complex catalytic subunit SEC11 [Aspergillus lentulus]GFF74068.1 signal peptidase complex catalytic subunit SEC11 [Aspergillus lentulus]
MRSVLNGILAIAQVVAACFMAWKALSIWAGMPYPVMIVTTESMAPAFVPGDVLFISNHHRNVAIGDMPSNPDLTQLNLTKRDNNLIDDTLLYPDGQNYLARSQVLGLFGVTYPSWDGLSSSYRIPHAFGSSLSCYVGVLA